MTDETRGREGGRRPGLGAFFKAWRADGFPVLHLMTGSAVDWQPDRPWRLRFAVEPAGPAVILEVEQSPFSAETSDLVDLLVLSPAPVPTRP